MSPGFSRNRDLLDLRNNPTLRWTLTCAGIGLGLLAAYPAYLTINYLAGGCVGCVGCVSGSGLPGAYQALEPAHLSLVILASTVPAALWVTVVHEGTHAILLRLATGRWPVLRLGYQTISVGVPGRTITRTWALAELVAPVLVTTTAGIAAGAILAASLVPVAPLAPTLIIGISGGLGAAAGDLYGAYLVLLTPRGTRIEDTGTSLVASG